MIHSKSSTGRAMCKNSRYICKGDIIQKRCDTHTHLLQSISYLLLPWVALLSLLLLQLLLKLSLLEIDLQMTLLKEKTQNWFWSEDIIIIQQLLGTDLI